MKWTLAIAVVGLFGCGGGDGAVCDRSVDDLVAKAVQLHEDGDADALSTFAAELTDGCPTKAELVGAELDELR